MQERIAGIRRDFQLPTHAQTENERTKIQCAIKHFQVLGIRAEIGGDRYYEVKDNQADYRQANACYQAPVKEYSDIKI